MLDEVSPQKFESLEVPVEKHSVVLLSLQKALDGLGNNAFDILPSRCKLPLGSKIVSQSLDLSLVRLASFRVDISSFFNFKFFASKVITWVYADSTLAS